MPITISLSDTPSRSWGPATATAGPGAVVEVGDRPGIPGPAGPAAAAGRADAELAREAGPLDRVGESGTAVAGPLAAGAPDLCGRSSGRAPPGLVASADGGAAPAAGGATGAAAATGAPDGSGPPTPAFCPQPAATTRHTAAAARRRRDSAERTGPTIPTGTVRVLSADRRSWRTPPVRYERRCGNRT